MARQLNTANWVKDYESGMQSAGPAYIRGIDSVTESPTAAAARALPKARRKYLEAIDSGYTASRLNAISNETWKTRSKSKGAPRLGTGAIEARAKMQAYVARIAGPMQQLMDQIAAMPSDTDQDMEARQLAWTRGMKALKAQR